MNVAIALLRNITVRNIEKDRVILETRKTIISLLTRYFSQGTECLHILLTNKLTQTSLNNGILFLYEGEVEEPRESYMMVWEAYLKLIETQTFYMGTSFTDKNEDNFTLTWLLGGTLSHLDLPTNKLKDAFDNIMVATEGWDFESDVFVSSIPKISHLLTVGAMATEWLYKINKQDEAIELYDFVFKKSHNWLRSIHDYYPDSISTLLTEVWARLKLIHPSDYNEVALEEIKLIDQLEHILLSLTILLKNVQAEDPEKNLDSALLSFMREKYEELYPLERTKYSHIPERLKWYNSFTWWN